MEPKENSIPTGVVILWGLLSLQLLILQLTSASVPTINTLPGCPQRCGNVEIPYPFGIGRNCSMEGFTLNCTVSNGTYKPFVYNVEFLSISLSLGIARIANTVSSQCYNATNGNVTYDDWWMNLMPTPYRFSSTLNKFTTIGCMTLAYLIVSDKVNNSYWSGCVSMYYQVWFNENFTSTNTYNFSPCNYAVLVEERAFEFHTSYITTGELYKRKLPLMLDWAVRNKTCLDARLNMTSYACVSEHSTCVDSANGPGYLCNCSDGYQGNPYLSHGCQADIDECANKDASPCSGVCHNTQGGYWCSCPRGTHGNPYNGTCYQNQELTLAVKLVIGIVINVLIILIIMLCIHIICERQKLIKVKENNFQQHGGWLLLEEIGKRQGLSFKIFTEEELEQATNKFHKNNILGHGGFGTINHKNIVKLLGCCLEVEVPMLVYEYISKGTLFQLIHDNSRRIYISLETRLKIALESAEALAYLHSSASPPIIHGDVKSANILLDDHLTAKVSDFGASILAPSDETQFVTLVQGTCGYLDPEYLQTCYLTDRSDVYSFGVILLELLTGKKALCFEGTEQDMSLSSNFLSAIMEGRFNELLDDHIKYDEEIERINDIAKLAKACLNVKGEDRPSMKEVAEELDRLKKMKQHPWNNVTTQR
uniref:Wall-associated receptor kinase 2-like n=1 Tax=Ananas comosus var. bracteatus TaxID=296719 RepID=A0A6V7QL65_ANACO|nr:unnamed protein product [Ananas comosus var. bracteatus]